MQTSSVARRYTLHQDTIPTPKSTLVGGQRLTYSTKMQNDALERLFDLIATLRGDGGCPWDRDQDLGDILSDLVEEVHELQWAHEAQTQEALLEELGDVVFVLTFAIALVQEHYPEYTLDRVCSFAYDKIKRRHPHVFGHEVARNKEEGLAHWDRIKEEEKPLGDGPSDILRDVPANLPPTRRAVKIQKRVARMGFDWPDIAGIFAKIREELDELESALAGRRSLRCEEELGDVLFSVINLGRFLNIDIDKALSGTNSKFVRRYHRMLELVRDEGKEFRSLDLEEMDKYWERVKEAE